MNITNFLIKMQNFNIYYNKNLNKLFNIKFKS